MKTFQYPLNQTARISVDQRIAIEAIAEQREISMSAAIRILLDAGIEVMKI